MATSRLGGPAEEAPGARSDTATRRTQRSPIVLIFILSGVAGLIYEIVWSRQLVLVFGNTTQAVSAILTGFFGGMAIGNAVGGRLADRVRRPLRLYAALELVLALVVVMTPVLFRLIAEAYRSAFGPLETSPQLLALVRFALALLALAPATILMGATLPTLTRHLARNASDLSAWFGRLYAANTVGAVFGAAAAGLFSIELLGLTGTLIVGASFSSLAGILALIVDIRNGRTPELSLASRRTEDRRGDGPVVAATADPSRRRAATRNLRLALAFAFISGATALAYQTLWTRLLASGTGNSTYVFTLILVVFLAGLALGAAFYDSVKARIGDPVFVLGGSQLLVAGVAFVGLVALSRFRAPIDVSGGSTSALVSILLPVLFIVLPPTLVMGFTLPVASRLLEAGDDTVGNRTGLLLAWNTVGSIVGTFLVPFFVIPAIGSSHTVALVAVANAVTGLVLVFLVRRAGITFARGLTPVVGVPVTALLIAALVIPGLIPNPDVQRIEAGGGRVFQAAEDDIASVVAGTDAYGTPALWVTGVSMTAPTVDTRLMPILSLALRPQSRTALVVALGMGSTYRSALQAGLTTDAVELVPSVPDMLPWFLEGAASVRANPKGHIYVADGRNHVELTPSTYDIVVVDPPPPIYSAGVSVISSLEWYQAVQRRLTPGGVMMQWVPYGQSLDDFRVHVRTFARVFPHVVVALGPGKFGTYLFGSDAPLAFDAPTFRRVLERPGVLSDVSGAADSPAHSLDGWARVLPGIVWMTDGRAATWAGAGPLLTDDRPYSEYFLLRTNESGSPTTGQETLQALKPAGTP